MSMLQSLLAARFLRPIDVQAARLLERISGGCCPELPLAAAFASWATGQGHTCLPLSALSGLLAEAGIEDARFADVAALGTRLLAAPVVGGPGEFQPLILDPENRLYLYRFFSFEETIASALRQRALGTETLPVEKAAALLAELFPARSSQPEAVDWQRVAAALALLKRLVVISGGPGTGKTYTVARILAVLAALAPHKLRIGLAAPTGKAALRLQEAIGKAKETLPPAMAALIPEQAQTLHRLLGFQSSLHGFLHNRTNPLHLDLLILDEASMIDVPLMAALLAALPASCRVILLGDRDQLASVESGNLLGDICGSGTLPWSPALTAQLERLTGSALAGPTGTASADALADCLAVLQTSHRFQEESGISALARAVNTGSTAALEAILLHAYPDLHLEEQTGSPQTARLREAIERFFTPVFTSTSAPAALLELGRCRILCALREGPSGVEGINRLAASLFRDRGYISPGEQYYRGMPLIILHNDYHQNLFNGDTGILWPDAGGVLSAWFFDEEKGVRSIALARLPSWQPSYAITVHKSQGSEFIEVLLLLPREDVPILSRELLYTGITRARERLTVHGGKDMLLRALKRRVVRSSGLKEKLRRDPNQPGESVIKTGK